MKQLRSDASPTSKTMVCTAWSANEVCQEVNCVQNSCTELRFATTVEAAMSVVDVGEIRLMIVVRIGVKNVS